MWAECYLCLLWHLSDYVCINQPNVTNATHPILVNLNPTLIKQPVATTCVIDLTRSTFIT